jgi:hypothetical protein
MIPYGVDTPLILGVMEIGVFFSLVLFGVVALQVSGSLRPFLLSKFNPASGICLLSQLSF